MSEIMRSLQGPSSYLPLPESQPIRFHGRSFPGAASSVMEASFANMFAGLSFKETGVRGDDGKFGVKESCSVDLLSGSEGQTSA